MREYRLGSIRSASPGKRSPKSKKARERRSAITSFTRDPMKRYQMLIGGQWVDAAGGEVFETENPYLGKAWALVPRASALDVDRAVAAARNAFKAQSWSELSATARGALLRKLADLIAAEAERLAEIEVRDNGKLITEMRAQLRYVPQWFHYFGGLADKIEGRVIPID